jgi:predicted site-specific integrase-resolvase
MTTLIAPKSELLNCTETSQYLGVREQTLAVWRLTGRYDLPFIRVGRLIKYRLRDIEKFLASRTVGAFPE